MKRQLSGRRMQPKIMLRWMTELWVSTERPSGPPAANSLSPAATEMQRESSGSIRLTDFSFTGTLNSFPKLFKAIKERDIVGVLNNYKRFFKYRGKLVEMHRRNAFAHRLVKEMIDEGYFK